MKGVGELDERAHRWTDGRVDEWAEAQVALRGSLPGTAKPTD